MQDRVNEFTEFDRRTAETKFFLKLETVARPVFTFVCENELFGRAIYGDVEPYIICLQVARYSDHDIWMSVAPLLVKQCRDTKSLLRFEKFMKRHMCRSKHVRFAIQRFSSDLIFLRILLRKSFPLASLRNMDVGSSKKREDTAHSPKREESAADKSVY